jgi:hypothetical protein
MAMAACHNRHPKPLLVRLVGLFVAMCAVSSAPTFSATELDAVQLQALREQARALEHGEGVAKDPARAIELYCQGAKAGDPEARYSIGWMFANGRGVPRDDGIAAYFFTLAADQGHAPSRNMLRFVGTPAAETPECMREKAVAADADDDGDDGLFLNENQQRLAALIRRLAPEYGIKPRLALAVARTESNLDPRAVSVKNAQGLMQLIPETSVRFNVRKPFDPEQNVRGGLAYLRWLLAYFRGDVALVAAAYNAGEGAVNRYLGIPPYAETRGYVRRILEAFRSQEHPFDAGVTEPSPELPKILRRKSKS